MTRKKYASLLISIILGISCTDNDDEVAASCLLEPDPGNCLAAIPRYYYDASEQECKEFIWGGCGGVVPFETLEDCRACEKP
ncbi:BPTI/Kunitz domain-containing protein [Maribacter sp. HTCC2170]|uniref:BPTI/Kunitz domain-containing protein n=1 Tax=Maribacter sp. (strain HTCC2170 / KCCM 42371) TaxID=313603 RepID=UPI00006AE667|nr:BPTI/Kunitz domain-containing protein [Maribacter sp. HTCC2170]EAR00563.1 proteinase inhibitor I2, Kunitz metazoa [Maribacter sp. HTCC2170]